VIDFIISIFEWLFGGLFRKPVPPTQTLPQEKPKKIVKPSDYFTLPIQDPPQMSGVPMSCESNITIIKPNVRKSSFFPTTTDNNQNLPTSTVDLNNNEHSAFSKPKK
jgi:hypothetical protein